MKKPTPRPPEQRRGSPNRQEREPQRTAEESNLTHNHASEPISSRTQQPCWITVQKRGKQNSHRARAARNKTHAPTTSGPTTAAEPVTGLHAPMSATIRAHARPYSTVSLPPSTSRGTRTRTPNRAAHFECAMSTYSIRLASLSAIPHCRGPPVPPVGLEPTRPTGHLILSQACLPIPSQRPKKKGSGNKHERQPRDHSAPNQRDTRTPAAPPASPTRVRGHSQPAHPDRPNLLTNTESTLAQTPKRHPHAPSAPPMPPHTPCVTAPAAASTPALFPPPGRRSRT